MKLKNPLKNSDNANFNILFFLVLYCVLSFILIVMMSCLLGSTIVYLKIGSFIFDWEKYLLYSLKIGVAAGIPTGIGIWIKIKLQEKK
ncbi:hypothetical protein QVN60_05050 [Yersinia aleksiciae]|uniref:hypothetical protein n=1 Tax=Yersinia aleksiciae TaxID=263819 RepID=UPI0011A6B8AB|nr:hypothetical protein [Yersinia aleksiciae]MDN0122570.1 hypothetical protein [Yersinia aleksiciae]